MHQAYVIHNNGTSYRFVPRFLPHDSETRIFAETATALVKEHGVSIAIGDQPSIKSLDIAIELLQGARTEQIKSEELYGKII